MLNQSICLLFRLQHLSTRLYEAERLVLIVTDGMYIGCIIYANYVILQSATLDGLQNIVMFVVILHQYCNYV